MRIFYWQSSKAQEGNFGDDLNAWLWDALMPGDWPRNDDVMLAGVGTVLTRQLPPAKRLLILGSGAGYGELPQAVFQAHCHCYGVRGPLTAALLELDDRKVLADPAILIPEVFDVPPLSPLDRPVVFVPHLDSARRSDWASVCQLAGVSLVDPRHESKEVIRQLARARLVLAESMHAAIIADAYRVPWIPVWSSCEINKFKWADWALAVGARVIPESIAPPSRVAWLDNRFAARAQADLALVPGLDFTLGLSISQALGDIRARQALSRDPKARKRKERYLKLRRKLLVPAMKMLGNHPDAMLQQCAEQLNRLAERQGYLSDDQQLHFARERLYVAVEALKADRRDGFSQQGKVRSLRLTQSQMKRQPVQVSYKHS